MHTAPPSRSQTLLTAVLLCLLLLSGACTPARTPTPTPNCAGAPTGATPAPITADIPVYGFRIVNSYPHDPLAFTQGLEYVDGELYESTGLYGRSSLRRVALETGQVLQQIDLPPDYFGEGLTIWDDRIFQLTWQNRKGLVYDRETFDLLAEVSYATEGWGLTNNGRCLIMSDGTATLYFREPATFAEIGRLPVYDEYGPVEQLNELEYVAGEIYANVWHSPRIARISPDTGQVTGWIDLSGLVEMVNPTNPEAVLNGIAYDAENGRLFVTGKLWPQLFEIELTPP